MDTKVTQVAQAMIDAIADAKGMDEFIDSSDALPVGGEENGGVVASFHMTKDVGPVHRRGQPGHPNGFITYTVTVTAKYEPFE